MTSPGIVTAEYESLFEWMRQSNREDSKYVNRDTQHNPDCVYPEARRIETRFAANHRWRRRNQLTVHGLDLHVVELDEGGAFEDDFDRLLPVEAADVPLSFDHAVVAPALARDGGFEGEVVGSHDVDARHTVVIQL